MAGAVTLIFEVPAAAADERLDAWLARQPGAPTRSQIKLAAQEGRLSVGGAAARVSLRLRGGESVILEHHAAAPYDGEAAPEPIDLDVLYEDGAVVAINKPPGMVVHPAAGNRSGTLVNAILHRYPSAALPGAAGRPGIVHRLDRDTSGVILVARTVEAHEALSRQFRERRVSKLYLAVVRGRVCRAGEIDDPLGRHPRDRKRMSTAAARSRRALTAYEPLEIFAHETLLAVRPHTGRTHQIRVHLASRGWPVVGDQVYGAPRGRAGAGGSREAAQMPRQALHAASIRFAHPDDGRELLVEAPLPADFRSLLDGLRAAG